VLATLAGNTALPFLELGAVALGLAVLAAIAKRLGVPAIPLYLVAGLLLGEGGVVSLDVSANFISVTAQIGVLLLLFVLGLEYSAEQLLAGARVGGSAGIVDAAANFAPGFVCGLVLGWSATAAVLLGGVTWISSSSVVAKVLEEFGWLNNRETPAVLNLLVLEDLAMAIFLPIVGALVSDKTFGETIVAIVVALIFVAGILFVALHASPTLNRVLGGASNESLLLAVFGLTLLVGGLAEEVNVSAAIGAFLVGLALSGPLRERVGPLITPLRDLFAALFFLFFSFQLSPNALARVAIPAFVLSVAAGATKFLSAWFACRPYAIERAGRLRAGASLMARGEFSIVIASLGASLAHGDDLGAVAAAFVFVTAVASPLAANLVRRRTAVIRN
jgi:CPA2 family monovalent cation:H+ antiporter-2